jgi:hypothetical protein
MAGEFNEEEEDRLAAKDNRLPGLRQDYWAWVKTAGILILLVAINIVAFLVSYGWGVIITLPLTVFYAVLLFRDLMPRHRLPPGRPHGGVPA